MSVCAMGRRLPIKHTRARYKIHNGAAVGPTSLMLRSVSSASLTRACTMPLVCFELFSVLISCSSSRMLPLASFSRRRILSSRSCRCSPVVVSFHE